MRFFKTIILLLGTPLLSGAASQFEQKDIVGSTIHQNSVVGVAATAVPAVANKAIAEALIRCPSGQAGIKQCLVSFEGPAADYITLNEGEFIAWSLKGYLKQFYVKGATASTNLEIIINFEP